MNSVFFVIFTLSVAILTIISPSEVLTSSLAGAEKAVNLSVSLAAVYAVWMGITKMAEQSGVNDFLAKAMQKPVRFLFGNVGEKAGKYAAMNISANLLGMGGIATPMGITAASEMNKTGNEYAMNMLFVLAATGIQLLPSNVIALREKAGSVSPSDIILPTFISTVLSTGIALAVTGLIFRKKRR